MQGGWAAAAPDSEMDDPHQSAIEALESMAEEVESLALRSPSVDENRWEAAGSAIVEGRAGEMGTFLAFVAFRFLKLTAMY